MDDEAGTLQVIVGNFATRFKQSELQCLTYQVEEPDLLRAADALAALVKTSAVGVIFVDLDLRYARGELHRSDPEPDAIPMIRALSSSCPDVVIVAMSSYAHDPIMNASCVSELGITWLITRGMISSFSKGEMLQLLAAVTERKRRGPLAPRVGEGSGSPTEPELLVVSALKDELKYLRGTPRPATNGLVPLELRIESGRYGIAVAAEEMGLAAMAHTTTRMLMLHRPALAVLLGVCGGVAKAGTALGDVVVPRTAFHYQFGKWRDGKLEREIKAEHADADWATEASHIDARRLLLLRQSAEERGMSVPGTVLRVLDGPMASADLVVQDETKLHDASGADRKSVAIDMESYAFLRATRIHRIPAFVIKGVSDLADAAKSDDTREYAKFVATSVLRELVSRRLGWQLPLLSSP